MCDCGRCKDCDPSGWMRERTAQVGRITEFPPSDVIVGVPMSALLDKPSARDLAANAALAGLVPLIGTPEDGPDTLWDDDIADRAYALADAMMRARDR